jgi:hypothetical protein
LSKAAKRPPSLQADEPDPDWFIKQQALWQDGVANFAMLASTARLRSEEEIEVRASNIPHACSKPVLTNHYARFCPKPVLANDSTFQQMPRKET